MFWVHNNENTVPEKNISICYDENNKAGHIKTFTKAETISERR